jgi:hypothetical protein
MNREKKKRPTHDELLIDIYIYIYIYRERERSIYQCEIITLTYQHVIHISDLLSGGTNFRSDIKAMLGPKNCGVRLYRIFQVCWMFITPLLIIVRRDAYVIAFNKKSLFLGIDCIHIYQLFTTSFG